MSCSISVIQAVCHADTPEYLRESIDSILGQTRQVDEYIIVRDGALTQRLEDVLELFQHRIRLIDNYGRKGLAGCLNSAIERSSADIFVRMDSDDISMPNRIEILMTQFLRYPELMVIGTGATEIDSNGDIFFIKKMPETPEEIVRMALTRPPFIHVSTALKRSFFQTVGLYNDRYLKAQDYELWARTIIHHPALVRHMTNIEAPLITVRLPHNFWEKRSFTNIRYGTRISIRLIRHFNAYHRLIPLALKIIMRLSPAPFKKFSYQHLRNDH